MIANRTLGVLLLVMVLAVMAQSKAVAAFATPPSLFLTMRTLSSSSKDTKTRCRPTQATTATQLFAFPNTKKSPRGNTTPPSPPPPQKERKGPVVNISLVRQTVLNQALIGWTIWTGGYGAQVLARDAHFGTGALLLGVAGFVPLFFLSRSVETSEAPAVADLNLSTNMQVLRLFGDKPQPLTALVVSALLAGLTGLVEETTFRGCVLPQIAAQFDSVAVAAVLSTLIFAALHVNPISLFKGDNKESVQDAVVLVIYQLVTGSIFCSLFLLTENLAVPIIAHALFDFYVFYGTHLAVTTQMGYARNEALMPTARRRGVEDKWRKQRGDRFLLGAKETFYLADSNRDGVLSREELRIALYSYGIRLSAPESATVAQTADVDQSGAIDFGEFLEFVGPAGSTGKAIKNSLLGVNG